jgi:hypothetical protein
MANIQPNRFELQSNDGKTKVDYETISFMGQPVLNLSQGPGPIRHFVGSQIRRVDTEIGTIVTVTTQMTIDTGSTSFSILIPAITLPAANSSQAFNTEAIVTHHTGPISVPPTGVHETYQFIPMKGEASFVFDVFQAMMAGAAKVGKSTA